MNYCALPTLATISAVTVRFDDDGDSISANFSFTCNYGALLISNIALLLGLAVFAIRFMRNVSPISSLVPSLLVEWGLGYWAESLLSVFADLVLAG